MMPDRRPWQQLSSVRRLGMGMLLGLLCIVLILPTGLSTSIDAVKSSSRKSGSAMTSAVRRNLRPRQSKSTAEGAGGAALAPGECKYDFTVYVYELPHALPAASLHEEARRQRSHHICQKCIYEQFALEYVVHDFLTQFCGRTTDPEKADFFYLPVIRDVEYRIAMGQGNRRPSDTEMALLRILEKNDSTLWLSTFNVTDAYWQRFSGADHIIVMPAPVTNLRHEQSKRGFFHYMIQNKAPIFLNVEFSKSFIQEYPYCSRDKNLMMPYPTTDPDLLSGKYHAELKGRARNRLLFYQGGNHGSCVHVRAQLNQIMKALDRTSERHKGKSWRELHFGTTVFCPIPVGDSPSSKRMYDVMHLGCIPVVLSDDLVWAYSVAAGREMDLRRFSISLPQDILSLSPSEVLEAFNASHFDALPSGMPLWDIVSRVARGETCSGELDLPPVPPELANNTLVQILLCIPKRDVQALQTGVAEASPNFLYYAYNSSLTDIPTAHGAMPDGGAIEQLAMHLTANKKKGTDVVYHQCLLESRAEGHKYIDRYPCAPPKSRGSSGSSKAHRRLFPCDNPVEASAPAFSLKEGEAAEGEGEEEGIWVPRCPSRCTR